MLTVFLVLALAALVMTLIHAAGKPLPLWVPVVVICIIECLRDMPLGR